MALLVRKLCLPSQITYKFLSGMSSEVILSGCKLYDRPFFSTGLVDFLDPVITATEEQIIARTPSTTGLPLSVGINHSPDTY